MLILVSKSRIYVIMVLLSILLFFIMSIGSVENSIFETGTRDRRDDGSFFIYFHLSKYLHTYSTFYLIPFSRFITYPLPHLSFYLIYSLYLRSYPLWPSNGAKVHDNSARNTKKTDTSLFLLENGRIKSLTDCCVWKWLPNNRYGFLFVLTVKAVKFKKTIVV